MTRGRLHLPEVHQQWRSPGGVVSAGGTIYTDFPEEAVARLRAANKSTQPAQPPYRKGVKTKRKKEARPAPAASSASASTANAEPAPPPEVKPLVTMDAFEGETNHEKGAFIRRHFPDWLAYQKAHGLQKKEMMALTGVADSVWYNHQLGYRKHPERYGEPKPEPKAEVEPPLTEAEASLQQSQAGDVPPVETPEELETLIADLVRKLPNLFVPADKPHIKPMNAATAVGKIRELTELVGELRAAGAVVQVSVNWTMEL